jgi:cyclopropane-fatty-acyl-phospholipid synthase
MTYSCALFRDGARTLDAAQDSKHALVCRKLDLQPGRRVLDLGCGWGAFALHAAARHGVHVTGITLSPPQAEIARSRAADAGLEDRVDIGVMDYRDLGGERFDAVCSVGMVEHVGQARLDAYARTIASVLAPGGRVAQPRDRVAARGRPPPHHLYAALRLPRRRAAQDLPRHRRPRACGLRAASPRGFPCGLR